MSEIGLIVETLKDLLREEGLSYRDLAARLHVSESTIKRAFSQQTFHLDRLEAICGVLGLSLLEFTQRVRLRSETEVYRLSLAQERRFVTDIKFFLFFWLLVNRQELRVIGRRFKLTRVEIDTYLSRLENMGILELREKQRFTLKVPRNVVWNTDGPIERRIVAKSLPRFITGNFAKENEYRRFLVARLSPASAERFRTQLSKLMEDIFQQSVTLDATQADAESIGVAMAIGPLDFSLKDVVVGD